MDVASWDGNMICFFQLVVRVFITIPSKGYGVFCLFCFLFFNAEHTLSAAFFLISL